MPQIIIKRSTLRSADPQKKDEKVLIVIADDQVEVYTGQEAQEQLTKE